MHGAWCIERRLDDAPRLFHHVLARESTRQTGKRIVEQTFVRAAATAERRCKIDGYIDVLTVEVLPGCLGLQRERDAIALTQPEPHEVS